MSYYYPDEEYRKADHAKDRTRYPYQRGTTIYRNLSHPTSVPGYCVAGARGRACSKFDGCRDYGNPVLCGRCTSPCRTFWRLCAQTYRCQHIFAPPHHIFSQCKDDSSGPGSAGHDRCWDAVKLALCRPGTCKASHPGLSAHIVRMVDSPVIYRSNDADGRSTFLE